jgi:2-methylisocitrate lyase-like PEP mutase family enzyme
MTTKTSNELKEAQIRKIEAFRQLHVPGKPLIVYNIWDAGSARAVAQSAAKAIATSSWSVAKAHGFDDGEKIPYELAIANLGQIVAAVDLPVTFDLESGYGEQPEKVGNNVSLAIETGAVGCNFEDSVPATGKVRELATQVSRIQGARSAANAAGIPFFINARCDLFFQGESVPHDEALLKKTIERAHAYAETGADGLFVPGLEKFSLIAQLAKKSPLPLNILATSTTSLRVLADNGVARISYGATPYIEMLAGLEKAARTITG